MIQPGLGGHRRSKTGRPHRFYRLPAPSSRTVGITEMFHRPPHLLLDLPL